MSITYSNDRNYRPKQVEVNEIINKIIIAASSWLFMLEIINFTEFNLV